MKNNGQRKTMQIPIAACYLRLSDDDDNDGTSVSIETQRKILTEYCNQNGYKIFDFYIDDGWTGTNFNRPDFKRMIQDAEAKKFNTVIVKDLSRFGRNYAWCGLYMDEIFPRMNIRFIALGDNVDIASNDSEYDLMVPIKNVFNEFYPAECSRKTKQAFIAKASNGEYIGAFAPYGYNKSQEDKHLLEINTETAFVVRWIFEMAAYNGFGYNKIASVLSDHQVLTPMAYRAAQKQQEYKKDPYNWNLATVMKILNDKTYLGYLISGRRRKLSFKNDIYIKKDEEDWIVIPGAVPQIIKKELWDAAHAKLDTRKRVSTSGFNNIFAGLIKCDQCGYALGLANASNRSCYYMCNTYKKKGGCKCSSHYILYNELYDAVLNDINDVLDMIRKDKKGFVSRVIGKIQNSDNSDRARIEKEIATLVEKEKVLESKFDQLYDDKFSGLLSERKFKELSARCEAEQDSVRERIAFLKRNIESSDMSADNIRHFAEMAERYARLTELDADVLNRLIEKIDIGQREKKGSGKQQTIRIKYRFIGEIL